MKAHTGVIHGNIFEFSENLGLSDGEEVEIQVAAKKKWQIGEGLRRCAGALGDDWSAADDDILAELARDRLNTPHREIG